MTPDKTKEMPIPKRVLTSVRRNVAVLVDLLKLLRPPSGTSFDVCAENHIREFRMMFFKPRVGSLRFTPESVSNRPTVMHEASFLIN